MGYHRANEVIMTLRRALPLMLLSFTIGCEEASMVVDGLDGAFDPGTLDSDGDGTLDLDEEAAGTDPNNADSDADGWDDTAELNGFTDPLNAEDHPYTGGWPIGSCRDELQGSVLQEGEIAPQFELTDMYGDTVRLHDFCHMAVLVVTGAAWCGPCQAYRADAAAFYESYYPKGLMIIDLLVETTSGGEPAQADLEAWADGHPYAVVADPGWAVTNQGYATTGIPAVSLIAPGGQAVIVDGYPQASDIEKVLPEGFVLPEAATEAE